MRLQARVNLVNNSPARIGCPIPAILEGCGWDREILDVCWAFHNVGIEATGYMPSDMTMKGPNTRIIRSPLKDLIA